MGKEAWTAAKSPIVYGTLSGSRVCIAQEGVAIVTKPGQGVRGRGGACTAGGAGEPVSCEPLPPPREGEAATIRVLAYCHDGVGLGHLRRTLNICQRLSADFPSSTFLVATGNPYVSLFDHLPSVDYLKLPALRKISNECYVPKYLSLDNGQLLRCRQALLLETARHFDPTVVLVDKAPAGVCGELAPTLKWLRQHRPQTRIVFGMRDIEDESEATCDQWSRLGVPKMLEDYYDEVWVYGMREVFDVTREYRLSDRVREKLCFTGYVARSECPHDECTATAKRQVLVTVGGGTDGTAVLEGYLAMAAQRAWGKGVGSVIVAGPDLPPQSAARLRHRAAALPGVEWVSFIPCLQCLIRASELVVCMGGYNTLCEVVSAGRPALVIPRTHPRLEQDIRARLWEKRGLVRVLEAAELTPQRLGEEVMRVLTTPPPAATEPIDLRGLDRVCERFGTLLKGGAGRAVALPL